MSRSWLGPLDAGWVGIDGRRHGIVSRVHELPRRTPADVFTERLPIVGGQPAVTPAREPGAAAALFVDEYPAPAEPGPGWFSPPAEPVPVPCPAELALAASALFSLGGHDAAAVWVASWANR